MKREEDLGCGNDSPLASERQPFLPLYVSSSVGAPWAA